MSSDVRVIDSFADLVGTVSLAQLPPDLTAGALTYGASNQTGATLAAGLPVAVHSTGIGVVAATAADGNHTAVGLLRTATAAGFTGDVQTGGPLVLADWTAVAGTATLAARGTYFLAPGGGLTTLPPTTPGRVLQIVGLAVAPDTLEIAISTPILL